MKRIAKNTIIQSQLIGKSGLEFANVQKRGDFLLPEKANLGVNLGVKAEPKNFFKSPCQIEEKMLYIYGCQIWVRKGKPRVIGGRKATGPKNQVFYCKDSRAAEYR